MSVQHWNDDLLLYLSKKYLNGKDCLALSLSNVSDRFSFLYKNGSTKKGLVISECYFIATCSWKSVFQQVIVPTLITEFDASHVYWLPAQAISHSIIQMTNLEELTVQDTQISLGHLPTLFFCCKKIVKLSFTLVEKTLDEYQGNVSATWMMQGFQRLTHLKIFTFPFNHNFEFWLVTLGVLKWCRDCIDLFIDITYPGPSRYLNFAVFDQVHHLALIELFSHLDWMLSLNSLIIQRRGAIIYNGIIDGFMIDNMIDRISSGLEPNSRLKRIWIDEANAVPYDFVANNFTASSIKSLALPGWDNHLLTDDRFHHLEHLSGVRLHRFNYLHDLKYIRATIDNENAQELGKFCESHPLLEELYVKSLARNLEDSLLWEGNWKLLSLKVLVYSCASTPSERNMSRIIKFSPNIQRLHIEIEKKRYSTDTLQTIGFFYTIQFEHLTWLTFSGFRLLQETHLPSIVERCPKLERLHLNGDFLAHALFSVVRQLSLANNLRDLRLQWENGLENVSEVVVFLKAIRKSSPNLKRLVLYAEKGDCYRDPCRPTELEDFLITFVKEMPDLVALCLAGFQFHFCAVDSVKRKFIEEILPTRSAFWCHLGGDLPAENDLSVPRIHYNEIVNPGDWFDSPPNF